MPSSLPAQPLADLQQSLTECRACPRLVEWREQVAVEKRASFRDDTYWGRPVPSFGDPAARIVIVGLAPAAHGANRTGRMFTGDRSGDWLYGALHRAGLASQPESTHRDDGLTLQDVWVTAAVHCAPPANKPTPAERATCGDWLIREVQAMPHARVFVALGGIAYVETLKAFAALGTTVPRPRVRFGHGVEVALGDRTIITSYHPSQQNTFTGRLTEPMFDRIWARARALAEE